jgi:hypothetical protein
MAEARIIKRIAKLSGEPADKMLKESPGKEKMGDKDIHIDAETVADEVIKILTKRGIDISKILQMQNEKPAVRESVSVNKKRVPITDIQSVIDRIIQDFESK